MAHVGIGEKVGSLESPKLSFPCSIYPLLKIIQKQSTLIL